VAPAGERVNVVLRLLAFVLPLGVDSFAVAAALGASGVIRIRERLRVSLIFVVFEAGMPLVGLAAGAGLARAIGGVADYLAGAAVIVLGIYMLAAGDSDGEQKAGRLAGTRGVALLALGISISLDELAIGFSLGLARLPVAPVIIAIAVQALLASQLGLALGRRVSERLRERAEQLAAIALVLLGAYLITERLLAPLSGSARQAVAISAILGRWLSCQRADDPGPVDHEAGSRRARPV
jgi:manganese efflux pump family protein